MSYQSEFLQVWKTLNVILRQQSNFPRQSRITRAKFERCYYLLYNHNNHTADNVTKHPKEYITKR